jgi:intracellular sulfur oxidation DsrE/DsrF family protein
VVVLHGNEAGAFIRSNYSANRSVVDTAALLDAYGVIDVKMCATWMRTHAITERDIPPFIETVPFGPAEVQRLRNAGYSSAAKVKL